MTAVSVIIPVRDGECYLGEAIESVLGQTAPPAEVVVVDDGSADASADIAQGFAPAVRCVRQEAVGLAAACNRGLSEVAGELIAYIDADDLWVAGKLALQRRRLAAEPELDAVFGHAQEFLSPDLTGPPPRCSTEPTPFRQRGTMLIRRDAHDRAGRFDPSWRVGEFMDWHARASEAGVRSTMLEEVVLHRRLHATNMSRQNAAARVDFTRVARAALHRRRTGTP